MKIPGMGDYESFPQDIGDPNDPRYDGPEYDEDGNIIDANGNILVPADEIEDYDQ